MSFLEILILMPYTENCAIFSIEYIRLADQYVPVPGGANNNNYANVDLIIDIARRTRVQVWQNTAVSTCKLKMYVGAHYEKKGLNLEDIIYFRSKTGWNLTPMFHSYISWKFAHIKICFAM